MKYKPGQKLVCINKDGWIDEDGNECVGPEYNEIVTFSRVKNTGYIVLLEYEFLSGDPSGDDYRIKEFVPLVADSVLEAELLSISESKTLERV